jgi:hypothetical protein
MLDLIVDPEDGGIMLLRNFDQLVSNCVIIEQAGIVITVQTCIRGGAVGGLPFPIRLVHRPFSLKLPVVLFRPSTQISKQYFD